MTISQLINDQILPLTMSNTANEALLKMNEYKVSHFPVVNNGIFTGVIYEDDIDNNQLPLSELQKNIIYYDNHYINEQQNVFDVLKIASTQQLSLIPITSNNMYIGCITLLDLINYFAQSLSVNTPGGIIVLEVTNNNYSLTEIANIIESNNAKILSTYITSNNNSNKLEVFIKISKIDLNAILQTFDRYSYKIVASFGEEMDFTNIKDNYNSLINYLNI